MNKRKIGRKFEIEAFKILQSKFDSVEWLSEKTNSSFDFKCMKNGKIYFGDAKYINNDKIKPHLYNSQKEADFIILKRKNKITFIPKVNFKNQLLIYSNLVTTIQIDTEVWEELNKRKKVGESHNDVLRKLLKIKKVIKDGKM